MTLVDPIARSLVLFGVAVPGLACFGGGSRPGPATESATPIAVDVAQAFQRIDGFGASSAWTASILKDPMPDLLFSPTAGIGLSLLRIRIAPDGTTGELATAQAAVARGAEVWATPWSPPAEWKDNDNVADGGSLLPEHQQDWATRLTTFVTTLAGEGVPLLALSAQNEPNYAPPMTATQNSYESCLYTPDQLVTFVRDFLGPTMAAAGVTTPVMAPETKDWSTIDGFVDTFAGDSKVMPFIGPFATHAYGGTAHVVTAVDDVGKTIWETEYGDQSQPSDDGIDSGLTVAAEIHDDLVNGQVSAWHYWWINPGTPNPTDNSALTHGNQLTRRAYVLGNWSRFVRPGFVRVAATATPQRYVLASAFADPVGGGIAIVVVNQSTTAIDQPVTIAGATVGAVTPWVTSADFALGAQPSVSLPDDGFSYTLPARSVTTFVYTRAPATN